MSIFRALDVAQSALVANQRAMDVVSQNLAGAANPDYSRQQVELAARTPETIGGVVYGRGVDVRAVRRVVDPLVMGMLVDAHAEEGFARMRAQALADIAPVFGDATTSDLTDAVMRFFDAWRTFANQPADAGAQAQARVQSEALARTFRRQAGVLDAALVRLDQQLRDRVTQANALLDQIAALNREIQRLEASNARPGAPANDLRDQRDAAVRKLAALISVQWIPSANGEPMLQLASGDLLVQGGKARHLVVDASGNLALAETQAPIQAPLRGEIGGLVQARQDIQTLRGALDQMARDLAWAVNRAHGSAPRPQWTSAASQPLLPLTDPAQPNPLAARIQAGAFVVHVLDAAGNPLNPGGTTITITPGLTTMQDIAAQLNAIPNVAASVDAAGALHVQGIGGATIAFGQDTSGFLAAFALGGVFQATGAADMQLAPDLARDAGFAFAGYPDPATGQTAPADNRAAAAIAALADAWTGQAAQWITDFGTRAHEAEQAAQQAKGVLELARARRAAVSGVQTDEELVNMIRYQRAFEASAKVINAVNEMLAALLGVVR